MTDLIERLRAQQRSLGPRMDKPLVAEAADEIDRLRTALKAIANSKYPEDGEWYNAVYIARKALANE